MKAISYTQVRANLAKTLDSVRDDCEPVIITRGRSPSYVLMTLNLYESMDATAYLLSSPANAEALRESIAQLRRGEGIVRQPDLDA